jgi:GTP cyclohydrolase I
VSQLDQHIARNAIHDLLTVLGYDVSDPHFTRTPERAVSWLIDFTQNGDPMKAKELLDVQFPQDVPSGLVLVGPTEYRSMCAHHLLPVVGKAWVAYVPDQSICGLSKLSRLVEYFAMQLTVQERVTSQIADAIWEHLKPKGCMVIVDAVHNCMSFRGIRDSEVTTTTSAVRGIHQDSPSARAEVLSLLKGR